MALVLDYPVPIFSVPVSIQLSSGTSSREPGSPVLEFLPPLDFLFSPFLKVDLQLHPPPELLMPFIPKPELPPPPELLQSLLTELLDWPRTARTSRSARSLLQNSYIYVSLKPTLSLDTVYL